VTAVLADGTTAKSGGKVVKNVAGYDLGKLYTGAHGTLGVLVSTTWRLHPLPRATRVVARDVADPGEAGRLALCIARSTLTPSAVELTGSPAGPMHLVVVFEAIKESVEAQAAQLLELVSGGEVTEHLPDGFGQRPHGGVVVRIAHVPASLTQVLQLLPSGASVVSSACSGVTYVALGPSAGAVELDAFRQAIEPFDGTAVVVSAPEQSRATLDHWGRIGDSLALMRRVKRQFDPEGRLSPGRFVGGM
jgi:glycolate oxidase FAD binding subunit